MDFDIDVSGEDIFQPQYTIVLADSKNIVAFKFPADYCMKLKSRFGQGQYGKYPKSEPAKKLLKIRVYCVVIYHLFMQLKNKIKEPVCLNICKDFAGHENDIKQNLAFLLGKLGIAVEKFNFVKLSASSNAHHYAYLFRKDRENKLKGYVNIDLKEIEEFLK